MLTPPADPRCGSCGEPIERPTRQGWRHVSSEPSQHLAWLRRTDPVDIPPPLTERILDKIRTTKKDADDLVRFSGGVERAAGPLSVLYAQALDEIGGWCLDANGDARGTT